MILVVFLPTVFLKFPKSYQNTSVSLMVSDQSTTMFIACVPWLYLRIIQIDMNGQWHEIHSTTPRPH